MAAISQEVEIEVWPENWPAFDLFQRLRTQWFVGFGGPTGLRYEAVYPSLDRMGLSTTEWGLMFADLQVMEAAALEQFSENRSTDP
ncbi:DUF1799 domain-containing protein [Acidovorax sp. Root568]|uniref:DUF1799 domain-containing protein n=1 Tax=Acidovorax sp. Root568 TaxID=1736565 RepID=UPI000AE20151|nr:DUF1799 domain-containing protein [Acidovorax sp. Root568]